MGTTPMLPMLSKTLHPLFRTGSNHEDSKSSCHDRKITLLGRKEAKQTNMVTTVFLAQSDTQGQKYNIWKV